MEDFGYPPVFPEEAEVIQPSQPDEPVIKDKSKGKKVLTLCIFYLIFLRLIFVIDRIRSCCARSQNRLHCCVLCEVSEPTALLKESEQTALLRTVQSVRTDCTVKGFRTDSTVAYCMMSSASQY